MSQRLRKNAFGWVAVLVLAAVGLLLGQSSPGNRSGSGTSFTAGGDLSGTALTQSVIKINGAAVPASAFNLGTDSSSHIVAGGNLVFSTAYTNATTTLSNVPGLAFAVAASKNYLITCNLIYSVDTNTATPNWAFTGPASPTTVFISGQQQSSTATGTVEVLSAITAAFATQTTNATTTVISTNFPATLTVVLQNGGNAGTVQLQAKANGVGTLTIVAGSSCLITQG